MQVRAQKQHRAVVDFARVRLVESQHVERRVKPAERLFQSPGFAMSLEIEQRIPLAEHVLHRTSVREPHMRDAYTRSGVRRVVTGIPFGNIARLIGDERRACIGITKFDTSHVVHAAMIDACASPDFRAQRRPFRRIVANMAGDEPSPDGHSRRSPSGSIAVAQTNRPPLLLIAIEESRSAPALDHTSQFPRQVEGVTDARVHAETAGWNDEMYCVTCKEDATLAIVLRDK